MRLRAALLALVAAALAAAPAQAKPMPLVLGAQVHECSMAPAFVGTDGGDAWRGPAYGAALGFGGDDVLRDTSSAPNCLVGGDGDDRLIGGRGLESLTGGRGDDRMTGGARTDSLIGGPGADVLEGGDGRDWLNGGPGDDVLVGGRRRDLIDTGTGANRVAAGPGYDLISALNGRRDSIDCGRGRDRVRADRFDVLTGCERVEIRRRSIWPVLRRNREGDAVTIRLPYEVRNQRPGDGSAARGYRLDLVTGPAGASCSDDGWTTTSNEERVRHDSRGAPAVPVVHQLHWRGIAAPCAGRYRFEVVYFDLAAKPVDCGTLAEAQRHAEFGKVDDRVGGNPVYAVCPHEFVVGEVAATVPQRR